MKRINYIFLLAVLLLAACKKDPAEGIESHERAIEAVTLGEGLVQVGPAIIDRPNATVTVRVLMQSGTTLNNVKTNIQTSYKSTVTPASGATVNFAASNNRSTYTVTSETGETREWTVILQPFTEQLLGTYSITGLTLYGGTGPEYGGGGVFDLASKNIWPADGPAAEKDNTLTFTYTGVTASGNTQGKVVNNAGADGKYANFMYTGNPPTDVNSFYRVMPKGEGTWVHDYTNNTVTITFTNGTVTTTTSCTFDAAGTVQLGNGLTKTITDNAFTFTINGTDDWNNIYSDYDKIVKHPRKFWIDVRKQ